MFITIKSINYAPYFEDDVHSIIVDISDKKDNLVFSTLSPVAYDYEGN